MKSSRKKKNAESEPLILYNHNVRLNATIANNSRVFSALVAGVVTGIVGITGYSGFLVFLASQIANGCILYLACGGKPSKYFQSPATMFLAGIGSQTELLTFVLLWTLSNNLVYLF